MTLDLMGGLLLTAALLVNAHAFLDALDIRRSTALWLAACFGLWVGLRDLRFIRWAPSRPASPGSSR